MLGLYPLGSRVLHGLGLYGRFLEISRPMARHRICNGLGELVQSYELSDLMRRFGHIGQLERRELLALLRSGAPDVPLKHGVALRDLREAQEGVRVQLSDGTTGIYDLVVGADGPQSRIRELLFGPAPLHDTGWSAWVWWAEGLEAEPDSLTDYWGGGRWVRVQPTRGAVGVLVACPDDAVPAEPEALAQAFAHLGEAPRRVVGTAPAPEKRFPWKLADFRAPQWHTGRVALVGDAACAFLPTSGIGASMAMESAAVLADELGRTDKQMLPYALELYEKRRRRRVEPAQDDSRHVAQTMMVDLAPAAWGRDRLSRLYSLDMLSARIRRSLEEPI